MSYNELKWVKMFLSRKKFKTLRPSKRLCHLYPYCPSDRFLGGEDGINVGSALPKLIKFPNLPKFFINCASFDCGLK